jgi:hypothetical protein
VSLGKDKVRNVLLVNKLKPSLLSVNQTCYQRHFCIFDSQKCEIRREDTGKLVGTAPKTPKNVYILDAKLNEECHINSVDESWLWHRRLGHINFDNLVKVRNLGAVRNFPKIIKPSNVMCRHCQLGKQTRIRFKEKEPTTIHCDNTSAISLSKNPIQHSKSKHIPIKYHYLRDQA